MTDPAADARARAAETKRRRTEASLHEAAYSLIREFGWTVRLSQIAKQASVGEATLYQYFENKGDMFRKVCAEYVTTPIAERFENLPPSVASSRDFLLDLSTRVKRDDRLINGVLIDNFERQYGTPPSNLYMDFFRTIGEHFIHRWRTWQWWMADWESYAEARPVGLAADIHYTTPGYRRLMQKMNACFVAVVTDMMRGPYSESMADYHMSLLSAVFASEGVTPPPDGDPTS